MDPCRPRRAENGQAYHDDRWQSTEEYNDSLINDLLQGREDSSLEGLNMGVIKRQSFDRTRAAMTAFNPTIASKVLPKTKSQSCEERAAICIQSYVRGFLARRNYIDLLYEQYEQEEQERLERRRQQVEEGELLVENYKLQTEMNDNTCIRRNQRRSLDCTAVTIQRAWRNYRRRKYQESIKPNPTLNPLWSVVDRSDTNFMIRTNPFQKITNHEETYEEEEDQTDVFNDSLEQATEELMRHSLSTTSDFDLLGSENFEYSPSDLDNIHMEFPSPTTDWESIESCLNSEGETHENQNLQSLNLTDFTIKAKDLQICFVDDALSDDADEDGLDIKEYVIDKQDIDDEEKRDSGCVAGDEDECFLIKTVSPDDLVNTSVSQQESQHVMLELSRHEANQEKKLTVQGWTVEKLQVLMLDEIRALGENLTQLIQAQNEVLVRELMMRDALHLKQDSMLMEVEDTTK
ncbi:hypothetical protein QZH41_014474 [Actinostola sp. cb2023]|nr:hypothetical protein QZH41_014474 [Actinostola sp. cb2023]